MTSKQPGQPNKFWLAFTVSSFEMPIALALGFYGLASLIFSDFITPPSVDETYTVWLIAVWHILMGFGGLGTFIGRLLEWERLEMSGLAMLGLSCVYYIAAALIVAHEAGLGVTSILLGILWACGTRMWVLRKSLKAREIARNVVEMIRHNHANGTDQ